MKIISSKKWKKLQDTMIDLQIDYNFLVELHLKTLAELEELRAQSKGGDKRCRKTKKECIKEAQEK